MSLDAQRALHGELPVRLAADADLHRPWQQRGVEPVTELDVVAAARFDLARLAPPSLLDHKVTAYVAPNPMYLRRR